MIARHRFLPAAVGALAAVLVLTSSAQESKEADSPGSSATSSPSQSGDLKTPAKPAADEPEKDVTTPKQPSAADVLKAFQQDRPTNQVIRPLTTQRRGTVASSADGAGFANLKRDGDYLNNRPGRVAKDAAWWMFVFESDSTEAPEPPVRLLPNQQLERIVRETTASNKSVIFIVSGEVTLFESQNYLLVRKALRRRSQGNLQK